jgi:hypothetical protein
MYIPEGKGRNYRSIPIEKHGKAIILVERDGLGS